MAYLVIICWNSPRTRSSRTWNMLSITCTRTAVNWPSDCRHFLPPDYLSWRGWRYWYRGWSHRQRWSFSGSTESWPRPYLAWWEPCQSRRHDRESWCGTFHWSHRFFSAEPQPRDQSPAEILRWDGFTMIIIFTFRWTLQASPINLVISGLIPLPSPSK